MIERQIIALFLEHRDRLWAMAHMIVRDHHLAEDALQETLLIMIKKKDNYDSSRPLLPWAMGIARNKALKIVEKEGRYSLFQDDQLMQMQQNLLKNAEKSPAPEVRLQALKYCLSQVSEDNRKLLLQKYHQRLSARELSSYHKRSETAIFSLLQRLRGTLHRCVRQQGKNLL